MCNQQTYTLIFWSRDRGLEEDDTISGTQEANFIQQIEKVAKSPFHTNQVNFYSYMTGWQPKPMYKLEDFCFMIDKEAPDIFNNLK